MFYVYNVQFDFNARNLHTDHQLLYAVIWDCEMDVWYLRYKSLQMNDIEYGEVRNNGEIWLW